MPGRLTPPTPDKLSPQWAMSALTSVPVQLPAAGCTTSPAGLSMTMISSSSNTTSSGMFSGPTVTSAAAGRSSTMVPPALTRWPGSRIVAPSIATRPARISALWRERDSSATRAASTRSSRSPASSAATTSFSLRPCVEAMSNPSADDDQPLDPAAARMVAKVRWLMVISGATTLVAIAAVIGVIGYRVFKAEGSAAAAVDVTALLPKGARITATAVGEDRIAVTLEVGGAVEIRTFDLKTLKPAGRLKFAIEP